MKFLLQRVPRLLLVLLLLAAFGVVRAPVEQRLRDRLVAANLLLPPPAQSAFEQMSQSALMGTLGGLRSLGFGRFKSPEFQAGRLADLLLPEYQPPTSSQAWWLLSVFSPGPADQVQWGAGRYSIVTRGGRDSSGRSKLNSRVVREGSVLLSTNSPQGCIQDVSSGSDGVPSLRATYAVALPIHWQVTA